MFNKYRLRAERGAAVLDMNMYGWADRVQPSTLEMQYPETCLLSQIFGSYEKGLAALKISDQKALRFGFVLNHKDWWFVFGEHFDRLMAYRRYQRLVHAWLPLIRERQSASVPMAKAA